MSDNAQTQTNIDAQFVDYTTLNILYQAEEARVPREKETSGQYTRRLQFVNPLPSR